jgi:hypothetical protein
MNLSNIHNSINLPPDKGGYEQGKYADYSGDYGHAVDTWLGAEERYDKGGGSDNNGEYSHIRRESGFHNGFVFRLEGKNNENMFGSSETIRSFALRNTRIAEGSSRHIPAAHKRGSSDKITSAIFRVSQTRDSALFFLHTE